MEHLKWIQSHRGLRVVRLSIPAGLALLLLGVSLWGFRAVAGSGTGLFVQTTFTVTSTADSGPGTLRQALLDAVNGDTVTFDPTVFPPGSPVTIPLTSALPEITQGNLTIDASNAGVILDGSGLSTGSGFRITSNGNTIQGIQILNFPGHGVEICCGARNNTIGGDRGVGSGPLGQGNLIVANRDFGVRIWDTGTMSNTVQGNWIGLDLDGARQAFPADMAISPDYPNDCTLYVATLSTGVHKSTDCGDTWTEVNNGLTESRLVQVEIPPDAADANTVYALAENGYLFVTNDGGANWSLVSTVLEGIDRRNLVLSADFGNDQTMYASAQDWSWWELGDGPGVFKSTDGGVTWTRMVNGMSDDHVGKVIASPDSAEKGTLFALTQSGIEKTTDGGANWSSVASPDTDLTDLALSPAYASDQTVFVTADTGRVYSSTVGGGGWSGVDALRGDPRHLALSPDYAVDQTVCHGGGWNDWIYCSTDGGANWTETETRLPGSLRDEGTAILFSPDYSTYPTMFIASVAGVARSETGHSGEWGLLRGLRDLGNGRGVSIGGGASHNVVGPDNVISNNHQGVTIEDDDTAYNVVVGNLIGADPTGTFAQSNSEDGVTIWGGHHNLIGGGTAGEGNVVGGTVWGEAVRLNGGGVLSNTVSGNYIGTNVSGTAAIGNVWKGVAIHSGASHNVIGGDTAGERNIISGNGWGVGIWDSGTRHNTVSGNYIGTDASGGAALPNRWGGVEISNGASYNLVGGDTSGERNLISGNNGDGVGIWDSGTMSNTVSGNYIGTDVNGTGALSNGVVDAYTGVEIYYSAGNTIEDNLISGNNGSGVVIQGDSSLTNTVRGNYIGTDISGTAAIGNTDNGVSISNGAQYNLIGGNNATPGGDCTGDCNLISGNNGGAVTISGSNTMSNTVSGNYVGTDASGMTAIGNGGDAVHIWDGAAYNTVGGTTDGERNVVSGNDFGVVVNGAHDNRIVGNYLGVDATGSGPLGNQSAGAGVGDGGQYNVIEGNIVGANGWVGIYLHRPGTRYNRVIGNYIGTDVTGAVAVGNGTGVEVALEAQENVVGGDTPSERNIISGNDGNGVTITGSGTMSNTVSGNYIGIDASGRVALGNHAGVEICGVATDNTIGGTTAGERNVIAGNNKSGVHLCGGAAHNRVLGNYLGTDATGTTGLGNAEGVGIDGAQQNTIGPDNLIAYNVFDGVWVDGPTTTGNTITRNAIHDNGRQGIENINGGNGELAPPVLVGAVGNTVTGTAPPTSTVEIFGDDGDEGRFYLGSTTADALGHFQFTGSLKGLHVTATATDGAGNTSEFAGPVTWEMAVTDTFETNDDWTLAYPISATVSATTLSGNGDQTGPSAAQATYVSYISRPDDVDFYKLPVPPRGSTVIFSLTGLPEDFDLLLYSPTDVPSDTPLRDVPLRDVPLRDVPLRDVPLRDVPLRDVPLRDVPLRDVPLRDVPLRDVPLRDVSFARSTEDEQVSDVALYATDFYYVQVLGHNGVYSSDPYTLQVEILPPPPPPTYTRTLTGTGTVGTVYQPFVSGLQTLIVVNKQRIEQFYDSTAAANLMARLQAFADHPTVKGMILPVETDPAVAAAYDYWDDNVGDPEAANQVAGAIKHLLNTFFGTPTYPHLTYLVIVGSDEVVPFRRVQDIVQTSNEHKYRNDARVKKESALYASLKAGYVWTDDFYVDFEPTNYRGRPLYVPNYPVGRLVETPDEIIGQLDYYLISGGILTATTSLTVGYDFLADSSLIISDTFRAQGLSNEALISDDWNAQDLIDFFLTNRHDINAINAHFQHWRLEPGDRAGGLFQSDEIEPSEVLSGTVIFSMGCHAGLSVCDLISTGGPASLDFAQAFARKRAVYVANTGYGYGDDAAPTLSEELMSRFAHNLGEGAMVSVGQALLKAKREHALLNLGNYGPYDEKVLIEATLYGPPMVRVSVPSPGVGERRSGGAGGQGGRGAREQGSRGAGGNSPLHLGTSAPVHLSTSAQNGLIVRSYTVTPTLTAVSTPDGTYYTADDGVQAMLYRPLQPRVSLDIALPNGVGDGAVAHGALFLGGSYTDTQHFDPVITMPVTETARYEPQWIYTGWRPQALTRINQFETPQGVLERLVLILGQFHHTEVVADHVEGIQRLYSQVTYDVYYSTSDDITPPTIESATAQQQDSTVHFAVQVSDASGVGRVVVTYTDGAGAWQSLELTYDADADQWVGELAGVTQDISFMAQAVDGAGNVGTSRAKGLFFTPIPVDAGGDQTADEGDEVTFSGSGPADMTVAWAFGDGLGATGTYSPTHRYRDDGLFEAELRVSDEAGGIGRDTLSVTVSNISPTVSIDAVTSPSSGLIFACDVVTFTASFTDPGVLDSHTATVDWGDGTVGAGAVTQGASSGTISGWHRYAEGGTFTVQVCAADDDGGSGCDTVQVTVRTADSEGDGDVDIVDIAQVVRRWGASPGDGLYQAKYDLNDDGIIDVTDIQWAAAQWRRSC